MRKIDVFFYGLFMDESLLQAKGLQPTNLRKASVQGFELKVGSRASLVPASAGRVYGIVASLSHSEVEQLYSDPSVRAYRPEALLARLSNEEVSAVLCFNLVEPPSADERNPEYASKLRALAAKLGFPAEYIASIR